MSFVALSGQPRIPVLRPRLPRWHVVADYLRAIDEQSWYSNFGPLERRLRVRLAEWLGCSDTHVVTASSATAALTGLVATSGLSTWEVPAFTFPAAAHAVIQAGRVLRLVDIDRRTMLIPTPGRSAGTGRIEVLPFGCGVPADLLQTTGPELVIDAAASLGAASAPLSQLRPGDAVVFSLHATKVLGCGEGGVAVCGSEQRAHQLRSWTNFGFEGSRESRRPATNAKLSEYAAAVAHAALDEWPATRAAWQAAQLAVRSILAAAGVPTLPPAPPEVSPYCIAIFGDTETAGRVEHVFGASGIETRRWWAAGLHRMPAFAHLCPGSYPAAEEAAARLLGLPVYPGIDEHALARITAALAAAAVRPRPEQPTSRQIGTSIR